MTKNVHVPRPIAILALLAVAALPPASASARRPERGAALPAASTLRSQRAMFGSLADRAISVARKRWWNRRLHWYNDRLADHDPYPLATIWSSVPLFEALDMRAQATHSPAARRAVRGFAAGAERYFDRAVGGYAPYPGDRGMARTWFDDNGWWGLAFYDAYRATGSVRYLADAKRAFAFIASQGWAADGGLWWNTSHPFKAGEALAAGSLLGAELYSATRDTTYLDQVDKFLAWGNLAMWNSDAGLYARTDSDRSAIPYVNGPIIAADALLCQATGESARCDQAESLASTADQHFGDVLTMGPQFDVIYVHAMLILYGLDHDPRWYQLAWDNAQRARSNAGALGRYPKAWDGGSITAHQARPAMLQTQAATAELFALVAGTAPPS